MAPIVRELKILNRKGLHARATAKFVLCAAQFNADLTVSRGDESVGGSSIMGILTLGAAQGSIISVSASGPEAEAAIEALTHLVAQRFGEEE